MGLPPILAISLPRGKVIMVKQQVLSEKFWIIHRETGDIKQGSDTYDQALAVIKELGNSFRVVIYHGK